MKDKEKERGREEERERERRKDGIPQNYTHKTCEPQKC